jgi:hypothetical protein
MTYWTLEDRPGAAAPQRLALSTAEKAQLLDLALAAAGESHQSPAAARRHAHLIAAFARAYVMIRDREDGLV